MKFRNAKAVFVSVRVHFILLAAVCAGLGAALAVRYAVRISLTDSAVALFGALCAHAAVNMLNDCHDFRSGLDLITRRTPFSGGSGALPERPQAARTVLAAALFLLLLTVLCGGWFLLRGRWGIVPLGLFGLLLIAAYTPWITRHPWICLITPGLAFGPLITGGTFYVLTGAFPLSVLLVTLVPFFLVNNLLLLNQFPDTEADRAVGRLTLPILLGFRACSRVHRAFSAAAFGVIAASVPGLGLPRGVLAALALFPLSWASGQAAARYAGNSDSLRTALLFNVLVNLLTPAVLGICLIL